MIYYPHISSSWDDFVSSQGFDRALPDVISCIVTEERNGAFDLEMKYPFDGENASMIALNAVISSIPRPGASAEPFRIYAVKKDINGVLVVRAHSCVYDADGIVIEPFTATNVSDVITGLNSHTDPAGLPAFRVSYNGYSGWWSVNLDITVPTSLFACLGQAVKAMGGELGYHYNSSTNHFEITIYSNRGVTSSATVAYGVNITKMDAHTDCEDVYTDIFPYYLKEGALVILPEKTISTGVVGKKRTQVVNLTSKFAQAPTDADLRTEANAYIAEHTFDYVDSTAVDFVPLAATAEYSGTAAAQAVNLCDTLSIKAARIGVTATAKVVKTVHNVILDKYDSLTVGEIQQNVADTIARLEKEAAE